MSSSLTTFKFDDDFLATLEALKKATKAPSRAETVRRAIRLLKLVQDAKSRGDKVVLVTKNKRGNKSYCEIILP